MTQNRIFLKVMDETQELLRRLFRTSNRLTLPMSATGSGGMETCLVNLVEPGDRVVVGVHGAFGARIAEGQAVSVGIYKDDP